LAAFLGSKSEIRDGADDLLPGGDTFFLLPTPTQGKRNEFRSIFGWGIKYQSSNN